MWELTAIVVGFLVVSAGVIALARSTTARWERQRRATRSPRRAPLAPPARPSVAARLGGTLAAFGQHAAGRVRVPRAWRAVRHVCVGHRQGTRLAVVIPRPRRAADPSVDDGEVAGAEAHARRRPSWGTHPARRRLRAGTRGHGPGSVIPRLTRQLTGAAVEEPPTARPDRRAGTPGAGPVAWETARQDLTEAGLCWVATVRVDGRPHVTPLSAVVLDDVLFFCAAPAEQLAEDLAADPRCSLVTGDVPRQPGLGIVLEGTAVRVTDEDLLRRLADAWAGTYGEDRRAEVADGSAVEPADPLRGDDAGGADIFAVVPGTVSGVDAAVRPAGPAPRPALRDEGRPAPAVTRRTAG